MTNHELIYQNIEQAKKLISEANKAAKALFLDSKDTIALQERLEKAADDLSGLSDHAYEWKFEQR